MCSTKSMYKPMKKIIIVVCLFCIQFITGPQAVAQHTQGLAPTPPMGWNSWNWFGTHVNAKLIRGVIDAIATNGLKAAGYEYVVIDAGWAKSLTPDGRIIPFPKKFPHGIEALADYAHSKGLKFGLHWGPGTKGCAGIGRGFGHEKAQVQQFAEWGVDFIKLDKCGFKLGWTEELLKRTYFKWRRLLDQSGRDIVLSISAYEFRKWYPKVAQMARTTSDINSRNDKTDALFDRTARSVMHIAIVNDQSAAYAGDGYWNNPDMLVVGNQGLALAEQKVHFGLWCIMTAPLMLGNDPRHMSPQVLSMVTNDLAIAVDQDPTEQGSLIKVRGDKQIWAKQLSDGSQAVLMVNLNDKEAKSITLKFAHLGMTGEVQLKNIYEKKNIGVFSGTFSRKIQPNSGLFLLMKPIEK